MHLGFHARAPNYIVEGAIGAMRRVGGARVPDPRGRGRAPRGHLQRAEQRRAIHHIRSALYEYLVEMWGYGIYAASVVQRIALAAVDDHRDRDHVPTSAPELVELAELGSSGANPQNCHAELDRKVAKAHGAPKPTIWHITMKSLKRREGEQVLRQH